MLKSNNLSALKPSNILTSTPSKQKIINWIRMIVKSVSLKFKIEDLGKGSIYCHIVNYYFNGVISKHKIIEDPKN